MKGARWFCLAGTFVSLLGGCGGDPSGPPMGPCRLRIAGRLAGDAVFMGDSLRFGATGTCDSGAIRWFSSDIAVATAQPNGVVYARSPGVVTIRATAAGARDSVELTVTTRPGGYGAHEIAHFNAVAFGGEFGPPALVVRRWVGDVTIGVTGNPTIRDREVLVEVVGELNNLSEAVRFEVCSCTAPDLRVFFAPVDTFPHLEPHYVPGNLGFVWVETRAWAIVTGRVLISTVGVTQEERNHLIREEVTQATGLLRDAVPDPSSIFYGPWSATQSYAPIDRTIIEMLHRDPVVPGLSVESAGAVLRTLIRVGRDL